MPKWKRDAASRMDELMAILVSQQTHETQPERKKYLQERWKRPTLDMLKSSMPAGRRFRAAQYVIAFGTLAIPILASFNAADDNPSEFLRSSVLAVSLIVAGTTALVQALRFRENFEQNWRTASALESVAWACVLGVSSGYEGKAPTARFPTFVAQVESLLSEWSALAGQAAVDTRPNESLPTSEPPVA